jgi:hypothetical protein
MKETRRRKTVTSSLNEIYYVRDQLGNKMVMVTAVAGVLNEPYSQLTPLSGAAVQARQYT